MLINHELIKLQMCKDLRLHFAVSTNYHFRGSSAPTTGTKWKWQRKIILISSQGCFKYGWALSPCPLLKSPLYLPWLLIFWVSDENLWHHNYSKMTSLYNLARNFEISPTFLIYFDWNLMGIILSIWVLRLLKTKCF